MCGSQRRITYWRTAFLNDDARKTQNLERKERYHTKVHLEGLLYEGEDYASDVDIAAESMRKEVEAAIDEWLHENLTGAQYRRFNLLMEGKSLIEDERVNKISNDAKILYMLFIDRLALPQMNSWVDQEGEVYIYYSVKNMCEDLHCHTQKVAKLLDELEFEAELIRRKHQGQGKPNRIYPKLLEASYPQAV